MGCGASSIKRVSPDDTEPLNKSHFDVERVIGQGGFGKVRFNFIKIDVFADLFNFFVFIFSLRKRSF